MATGWLYDQLFDDGNYTPKEMLTDAVVGLLGGSLLKPAWTAGRRAWMAGRHYIDDAARLSSTLMDDLITWGWIFSPFVRPTVATGVGYAVADTLYDTFYSESSASSSSSYQQNGGAGGINKSYRPEHSAAKIARMSRSEHNRVCRDGFDLRKVGGKWMCVPRTSKKSRSR